MIIERPMFPPVDPTRRRLFTVVAAGASAAGLTSATGINLPTNEYSGLGAKTPSKEINPLRVIEGDPALRAVNAHRQAAKIHTEAVEIQFASEGKVTKAAYARLVETTSEARDDMFSAANVLVKTQPTTMLGAIAMLQYLSTVYDDEGSGVECSTMPETVDDEAWPAIFFRTLASALVQVRP